MSKTKTILKMSGVQKLKFTEETGTEYCPYCDSETDFKFHALRDKYITCQNCGEHIMPCTLCNPNKRLSCCEENCEAALQADFLDCSDLWDDNVNEFIKVAEEDI